MYEFKHTMFLNSVVLTKNRYLPDYDIILKKNENFSYSNICSSFDKIDNWLLFSKKSFLFRAEVRQIERLIKFNKVY